MELELEVLGFDEKGKLGGAGLYQFLGFKPWK